MNDRWRPVPGPGAGGQWLKDTEKRIDLLERRTRRSDGVSSAAVTEFPRRVPGVYICYNDNVSGEDSWETPVARMRNGFVQISGMIALSTATIDTVLFTLPAGWRPDTTMSFPVGNTDVTRSVNVRANGQVVLRGAPTTNGWFSLDRIIFPVAGRATWTTIDPAGTAGSDHAFQNGWADYGSAEFGKVRYWEDEYGVVWYAGLAAPGTTTSNTLMFALPEPMKSTIGQQHMGTVSNSVMATVATPNVAATSGIVVKAPTPTSWVSLCGVTSLTARAMSLLTWRQINVDFVPANGWTTLGGTFPALRNVIRPDGLAFLSGMATAGTIGSKMMLLLDEARTKRSRILVTVSADAHGRLDLIGSTGNIVQANMGWAAPVTGSNAWFSLDALKWICP